MTSLIVSVRPKSIADLVALGAGNCNDLALNKLGAAFRTINLVDIGRTAVEYGMQQQSFVGFIGLNVVAPCDGTGWFGADSPPMYLAGPPATPA